MTAAASTVKDSIRVMVVDDSAVIRTLITRILEEDSQVSVVATAGNGQIALNKLTDTTFSDVGGWKPGQLRSLWPALAPPSGIPRP